MNYPLKRHSERITYMRHSFIPVARVVKSVGKLATGREFIWNDLGQIEDPKVRQEAQELFRNTMNLAEAVEKESPERISSIVIDGTKKLIEYLEANDVGGTELNSTAE